MPLNSAVKHFIRYSNIVTDRVMSFLYDLWTISAFYLRTSRFRLNLLLELPTLKCVKEAPACFPSVKIN
jgi:hypothetical protein